MERSRRGFKRKNLELQETHPRTALPGISYKGGIGALKLGISGLKTASSMQRKIQITYRLSSNMNIKK